jgi:hypothetical protein
VTTVRESYVVQIYRRDPEDPQHITGVVEFTEADQSRGFHTIDELLRALGLGRPPPRTAAERRRGK